MDEKLLLPTAPPDIRTRFIQATRENVCAGQRCLAKGEVYEVPLHVAERVVMADEARYVDKPTIRDRVTSAIGRKLD